MKRILLLLLLGKVCLGASAQSLVSTNLPIVILDTYGQTILDDPRIVVSMGIIDNGAGLLNHISDPFNDYDGEVTIEIRGSSSQQYPKKSYGFTPVDSVGVKVNIPMLQMPAENDWVLYAPYPDKTMIRNSLAYALARDMGHYASRTRHVELVRNGGYRGVYELHEKIKRDKNRVDIAKLTPVDTTGDELTGGYIIKIDKTTGSGTQLWYSAFDPKVHFQYHDPEDTELLPVQQNYIQDYVNLFETALQSAGFADPLTGWRKYADELSFIDFFILQELGRTVDGYRSSTFLHKDKDSKGGKLTMGPMWDFNLAYGNADYCAAYDTVGWQYQFNSICSNFTPHIPFWWDRLLQDTVFANNLRCRWDQLRQSFLSTPALHAWIDSAAAELKSASPRNFVKWPILGQYVNWNYFIGQTYQEEIDYMKDWIAGRASWLDSQLPGSCLPSAMAEVPNGIRVNAWPNPFSSHVMFEFDRQLRPEKLELEIRTIAGKLVERQPLNESNYSWHGGHLSPGVYFYMLRDGTRVFARGRIVRMR